jgi:hypothetical protein
LSCGGEVKIARIFIQIFLVNICEDGVFAVGILFDVFLFDVRAIRVLLDLSHIGSVEARRRLETSVRRESVNATVDMR